MQLVFFAVVVIQLLPVVGMAVMVAAVMEDGTWCLNEVVVVSCTKNEANFSKLGHLLSILHTVYIS